MTHYDHLRLAKPDRPGDAAHRLDAKRMSTLRPDRPGARGGCGSSAHRGEYTLFSRTLSIRNSLSYLKFVISSIRRSLRVLTWAMIVPSPLPVRVLRKCHYSWNSHPRERLGLYAIHSIFMVFHANYAPFNNN